jgi:hypothetical protein
LHKPFRIQFAIGFRKNFESRFFLLADIAVGELPAVGGCHIVVLETIDHAAQPVLALRP